MRAILFIFVLIGLVHPTFANVIGAGTDSFNPTPDALDYVTVQSSKTLRPGIFNLQLFANYADNTLPDIDTTQQNRAKFSDDRSVAEFGVGVGLADRWDVGLSIPTILNQTVDAPDIYGDFATKGRTEIRANTKYRILGGERGGLAAIGTVNLLQTEDDPFSGRGAGPIFNLEFAVDHTFQNAFAVAANLGHRWRQSGTQFANSAIDPLQNQFIFSFAASYFFESVDTKIIGEIFGSMPSQSSTGNLSRTSTSAEVLLGLRHEFSDSIGFQFGGSTELIQGVASPDLRVYAGLSYTFGPLWGVRKDLIAISPNHSLRTNDGPVALTSESAIEAAMPERQRIEVGAAAPTNDESFYARYDLFDGVTAKLSDEAPALLQPLLDHLKSISFNRVTVEVHSDSMGTGNDLRDLSQERANAIRKFLIDKRIAEEKIKSVGYGPSRPIANNGNYQGRWENRRVVFDIDR